MLKIWGRRNSFNVQKVMWLIGELNIAHEHISLGGFFGGLNTPEFLAMNPNGRIPVISDNGLVIWELHNYELKIERPVLHNVEAWYRRLQERPAYREHVMVPFDELKGRLNY